MLPPPAALAGRRQALTVGAALAGADTASAASIDVRVEMTALLLSVSWHRVSHLMNGDTAVVARALRVRKNTSVATWPTGNFVMFIDAAMRVKMIFKVMARVVEAGVDGNWAADNWNPCGQRN